MLKDEVKSIIEKRKSYDPEDYINIEKSWNELTDKLCENLDESIKYLSNECQYEEFSWISEVFDAVVDKTQSKEFIACLDKVYDKYKDMDKDHIDLSIEAAKDKLDWFVIKLKRMIAILFYLVQSVIIFH